MPLYLVERTFQDGMTLPDIAQEKQVHLDFIANNAYDNVTWIRSYVAPDNRKSFCIYDAPSPETLRRAARRNGLPIDRITEVGVLGPGLTR